MAADSSGLRQQCMQIAKGETSGDYDLALKAANKIIRQYPKETFAFKCKLVALIQLGQLDEALTLIKKTPAGQMGNVSFEKAYIHYRKNENDLALEELKKANQEDARIAELKSQLYYRLEKFQEAYDLLKDLLRNHSDSYDDTRRANLLAIEAKLESLGVRQEVNMELDTFEQYFNAACHLIEKEKYPEALNFINKSLDNCRKALTEDGLTDEEIEEEMATILVQKGYVLQMMGQTDEALEIYTGIHAKNPSDVNVKVTLLNNMVSRKDANIADARKKIKMASQLDKSKLSARQKRILLYNSALINLLSNQREPCRKALEELQNTYGTFNEAILLETALFVRQKDIQQALSTLGRAQQNVEAQLLAAQIHINDGNVNEGLEILSKLPENLRFSPAVTSLVVNLLIAQGQLLSALEALKLSLAYVNKQKADEKIIKMLLDRAATLLMDNGQVKEAIEYLEKLHIMSPDDPRSRSLLIRAYIAVGDPKAQQLMANFAPSKDQPGMNVDELEQNDWVLYSQKYKQKKEAKKDASEDMEVEEQIITGKRKRGTKRKRKRKIRLPKNYDPNVPLDPERWLPKKERSTYKKKTHKKFKDRDIGRGTQGAVATSPNIDYSNKPTTAAAAAATKPQENSPKPTPPSAGPRQQRPSGQPAKKKKKGGHKW